MKRVLLLTVVCIATASMAFAQGGFVGTYADVGGTECNLVDAQGLLSVYVVQTATLGSTAIEFSAPTPACFIGGTYLSWSSPFGVSVGDPVTNGPSGANSTAYGACRVGTIHVGTLSYFAAGLSGACCTYPILENSLTNQLVHVDCTPAADPNITPLSNTINGNATCPCGVVPTENATWGAVKSLYQ